MGRDERADTSDRKTKHEEPPPSTQQRDVVAEAHELAVPARTRPRDMSDRWPLSNWASREFGPRDTKDMLRVCALRGSVVPHTGGLSGGKGFCVDGQALQTTHSGALHRSAGGRGGLTSPPMPIVPRADVPLDVKWESAQRTGRASCGNDPLGPQDERSGHRR